MRGVKGLAAWWTQSYYGGGSLRAKRVQEPEGKRMIAASKDGSLLKLLSRDITVSRTCFP